MSDFRRRIMMGISTPNRLYPDPWVDDGYIWAYYNVTDTENPTTLLYGSLSSFGSEFIIDGQTVPAALTYQFQTAGEHLVKMTRSDALPGSSFRALGALVRLYLPSVITSLGTYAINDCNNLTHLWLSEEITTIGMYAIDGNEKLLQCNLYLPKLVSFSGNSNHGYYFRGAILNRGVVDFPSLTTPGQQGAFNNTQIVEVKNLGSITILPRTNGAGWFNGCSKLKKVVLPETLTTISGGTFTNCSSLKEINLSTAITSIGADAFQNCSELPGTLDFPELTTLGTRAFVGTKITSIKSLGTITTLTTQSSSGVFRNCTALVDATLPETLTTITRAFDGCTSLEIVTCLAVTPPTFSNAFNGCTKLSHIYVPAESVQNYKAASGWSSYANIIEAIPTT